MIYIISKMQEIDYTYSKTISSTVKWNSQQLELVLI